MIFGTRFVANRVRHRVSDDAQMRGRLNSACEATRHTIRVRQQDGERQLNIWLSPKYMTRVQVVLTVSAPLKIRRSVVCNAPVLVVHLWQSLWVFVERFRNKSVHTVVTADASNTDIEVAVLVRCRRQHSTGVPPLHELAPAIHLLDVPSETTNTPTAARLVRSSRARNWTPHLFQNRSSSGCDSFSASAGMNSPLSSARPGTLCSTTCTSGVMTTVFGSTFRPRHLKSGCPS